MAQVKKPPSLQSEPSSSGASEKSQLDWVLHSLTGIQNDISSMDEKSSSTNERVIEISSRMAAIETHNAYTAKSLERIEKMLDKQEDLSTEQSKDINKINTKIAVGIAIVLTAGAIFGWILNGQVGKLSAFMEQQKEAQKLEASKSGEQPPK